jgi:hypothetical protein
MRHIRTRASSMEMEVAYDNTPLKHARGKPIEWLIGRTEVIWYYGWLDTKQMISATIFWWSAFVFMNSQGSYNIRARRLGVEEQTVGTLDEAMSVVEALFTLPTGAEVIERMIKNILRSRLKWIFLESTQYRLLSDDNNFEIASIHRDSDGSWHVGSTRFIPTPAIDRTFATAEEAMRVVDAMVALQRD